MKTIKIYYIFLAIVSAAICGCSKFVELEPPRNSLDGKNVFANDNTAISAINGIYVTLSQGNILLFPLYSGLSGDELKITDANTNVDLNAFYKNSLSANPGPGFSYWNSLYPLIYRCNAAEEGLLSSNTLTPRVKTQLLGEVKFLRAFMYFYLVNLYGDVPLITTTDYKINSTMGRTPSLEVWGQITNDLLDARQLLSKSFLQPSLLNSTASSERTRPTYWAATALLSRVHLFRGNYELAEQMSSEVISCSLFSMPKDFNAIYVKNSIEAIFQLQPTESTFINTKEGQYFIMPSSGPINTLGVGCTYLNSPLLASFELGDMRKINWVGTVNVGTSSYSYPLKYKIGSSSTAIGLSEYSMVLRLAEQYLIRAEARIRIGGAKLPLGIQDINDVRDRATDKTLAVGNPNRLIVYPLTMDQASAINAVVHERQVELFCEWGHRWLDLKRSGKIDEVMSIVSPLKNSSWQSYQQLYPIPNSEILNNPSLVGHQNPGYQ